MKSAGRLWERFSGTGWEPGETALINNATVSEGATQSPYAQTFLLTSKQKTKKVNRSGTPFQFILRDFLGGLFFSWSPIEYFRFGPVRLKKNQKQ